MRTASPPDNLPIDDIEADSASALSCGVDIAALRVKYRTLRETIRAMDSVVVGFSGGLRSAVLTKVAHDVLGVAAVAAIVLFASQNRRDRDNAMALAYAMGVPLLTVETEPSAAGEGTSSDIFAQISHVAEKRGIHWIAYGAKSADAVDPTAVPRLWPRTPLNEADLTASEIAYLSHVLGLTSSATEAGGETVAATSAACAASIRRANAAEEYLQNLGFRNVTLHEHDTIARLEADSVEMGHLLEPDIRMRITRKLKSLGYTFVAVDLDGDATAGLPRLASPADDKPRRSLPTT